ncbi:MAG: hypothetical protein QM711_06510 [Micropruina sp.]|uniref:hypothetical protein n=1 Tax=Micropruina sp. TaxID=2737536 RepID=UPI0039E30F9B
MDMSEAEIVRLLRETVRQQRIWLVVVVVGAIVLVIAAIALLPAGTKLGAPVALAGVGVFLGVLITAPQRKLLAKLGLTREQAAQLLTRADVAGLTPQQLIERHARRRRTWRLVTAVASVIAVIAIGYFFSQAGRTVDDNVPSSRPTALFGLSFFAGAGAAITAIVGFVQLSAIATVDRARADQGGQITP